MSLRTIDRAVHVLQVLAEDGRGVGVSEIARRVRLGKSTTHRLLTSLCKAQLVRVEPQTRLYSLGFRLLHWTAAWLDRLDVRTKALPYLRQLREKCQETISLNLRDGHHRVAVERLETSHEVRFIVDLGRPLPLHVGAGGKAILAFLPDEEVGQILASTKVDPRSRRRILRDLAEIRRTGSAVTIGERIPGSGAVSAPVFNHEGRAVGSVSILSLAVRLPADVRESYRPLAVQAAKAISRELGWGG